VSMLHWHRGGCCTSPEATHDPTTMHVKHAQQLKMADRLRLERVVRNRRHIVGDRILCPILPRLTIVCMCVCMCMCMCVCVCVRARNIHVSHTIGSDPPVTNRTLIRLPLSAHTPYYPECACACVSLYVCLCVCVRLSISYMML
jgi:hypothetical protein